METEQERMAEPRARMLNDFRTISRCPLYRQLRQHSFCTDCEGERVRPGERNFCSVCRAFFSINFGGIRRKHYLNKLAELHRIQLEGSDRLVGARTLAVSFQEKFDVYSVGQEKPNGHHMTWLDSQIYVLFNERVRAFADESPFQESPNPIDITGLGNAYEMRASVASRSIFITDSRNYGLWKIQMPGGVISQWKIDGLPTFTSISAADEVVVVVYPLNITQDTQGHDGISSDNNHFLYIYRAADVALLRIVEMPAEIVGIRRMVASPNGTFIVAYTNHWFSLYDLISEVSADGRSIIRTFDLVSFKSITMKYWQPADLAVDDDGRIFVADSFKNRLYLLNQQMTDYQLIIDHSTVEPFKIFYVRNKQQLIISESNHDAPRVSILHLSPCAVAKKTRAG